MQVPCIRDEHIVISQHPIQQALFDCFWQSNTRLIRWFNVWRVVQSMLQQLFASTMNRFILFYRLFNPCCCWCCWYCDSCTNRCCRLFIWIRNIFFAEIFVCKIVEFIFNRWILLPSKSLLMLKLVQLVQRWRFLQSLVKRYFLIFHRVDFRKPKWLHWNLICFQHLIHKCEIEWCNTHLFFCFQLFKWRKRYLWKDLRVNNFDCCLSKLKTSNKSHYK